MISGAAIALAFEDVVNAFGVVRKNILFRGTHLGIAGRVIDEARALCRIPAGSQATFIVRGYLFVDWLVDEALLLDFGYP